MLKKFVVRRLLLISYWAAVVISAMVIVLSLTIALPHKFFRSVGYEPEIFSSIYPEAFRITSISYSLWPIFILLFIVSVLSLRILNKNFKL